MKKKKRKGSIIIPAFIIAAAVFLIYDSNTRIVIDKYTLESNKLPENFDGFQIVLLSDIHNAVFGDGNADLFDAVSMCEPDIIVLTGDIIDGSAERDDEYLTELADGLLKIAPTYYVTGNHEWASGWVSGIFSILKSRGVTALRNEYTLLKRGSEEIVLAGVDDPNGPYDQKSPEELVSEIRSVKGNELIIMLAHRNTELSLWASLGVDIIFSGHAHGGLIRLPFTDGLIAPGQGLFPTWTSGIYTEGESQMVVSRGMTGSHGVPRVLNNPEVTCVTLRSKSN